jgi:hypothetical protein
MFSRLTRSTVQTLKGRGKGKKKQSKESRGDWGKAGIINTSKRFRAGASQRKEETGEDMWEYMGKRETEMDHKDSAIHERFRHTPASHIRFQDHLHEIPFLRYYVKENLGMERGDNDEPAETAKRKGERCRAHIGAITPMLGFHPSVFFLLVPPAAAKKSKK